MPTAPRSGPVAIATAVLTLAACAAPSGSAGGSSSTDPAALAPRADATASRPATPGRPGGSAVTPTGSLPRGGLTAAEATALPEGPVVDAFPRYERISGTAADIVTTAGRTRVPAGLDLVRLVPVQGATLVLGRGNGVWRIPAKGTAMTRLRAPSGSGPEHAAVSPDGTEVAVVTGSGIERLDAGTGEARGTLPLSGAVSPGALVWLPAGIVYGSSGGIHVQPVKRGAAKTWRTPFGVAGLAPLPSAPDRVMATAEKGWKGALVNVQDGTTIATRDYQGDLALSSADGANVLLGSYLVNPLTLDQGARTRVPTGDDVPPSSVALSDDAIWVDVRLTPPDEKKARWMWVRCEVKDPQRCTRSKVRQF